MKDVMYSSQKSVSPYTLQSPRKSTWRWVLPISLVLLFVSTLIWLPRQAQQMEANERLEQLIADSLWVEQTIRFQLSRDEESLHLIGTEIVNGQMTQEKFRNRLIALLTSNREFFRVTWLNERGQAVAGTDNFVITRNQLSMSSLETMERSIDMHSPQYSVPAAIDNDSNVLLMDYHIPLFEGPHYAGSLVASYSVSRLLDEMVPWWFAQDNEILLSDVDDYVYARRMAGGRGLNVYTHRHEIDMPGLTLVLHTNSTKTAPKLLPNLLVGSVIVLLLGLLWSLWALWRDIARRLSAEEALLYEVSFRKAMEDSLVTGMRARDLQGRITYVNPAFSKMVGIPADVLTSMTPPMPYWPEEGMEEFKERFSNVLAGRVTPKYETVFQRANGERFPVLVFESPLVNQHGVQTGWIGSILDVSDLKRAEELNRQQEEKLQLSARLASMGEIASTLAHELNQPLAAISSYATGALNMMQNGTMAPEMLQPALEKIQTQAQRAGHIIRSVHQFVTKRDPERAPVMIKTVVDSAMPLIELQAKKHFVVVQKMIPDNLPPVLGDVILLEQVLLNLTRNAIQAMVSIAPERRKLMIKAAVEEKEGAQKMVVVSVIDQGEGISADAAERLFSPFFSTKDEGMGMGLNICRTMIEFHGGTLSYVNNPSEGTTFLFTLPAHDSIRLQ